MMIQQSMRLKVLILPLSLTIAVIVAIFFIKPDFSEMMSSKKALTDKQIQLEALKSQTQKLGAMKTKWEAMADEQNLVATAFPETESVDAYVSEITSKASRSGVLLSNIKVDQKSSGGTSQGPSYICGGDSTGGLDQAGASSVQPTPTAVAQPAGASSTPQPQSQATGDAVTMPTAPGASDVSGLQDLSGSPVSSSSCLNSVAISLSAKGSWEQMLDFFKYLEDMNRISNIETVTLSAEAQSQDQASSDILAVEISANAFFKQKSQNGGMTLATSLASQGSFNQNALEKLKETIYAPYDVPSVSPSGERNIFK